MCHLETNGKQLEKQECYRGNRRLFGGKVITENRTNLGILHFKIFDM